MRDNIKFVICLYRNEWIKLFSEASRESVCTWWRRGKWWKKGQWGHSLPLCSFPKGLALALCEWLYLILDTTGTFSRLRLGDSRWRRIWAQETSSAWYRVNQSTTHIYRTSARGKVLYWVTNFSPPRFITYLKDRIHVTGYLIIKTSEYLIYKIFT